MSSGKKRYAILPPGCLAGHASGVFMEFSARRRGEIHEGFKSFLPASMDCAPRELESPFARPFRLSGHIVGEPGQMYQSGIC